jgi:hypothetical protein
MMPALGAGVAQGMHDRAGPDGEPICTFCNGDSKVPVAAIENYKGRVFDYPSDIEQAMTDCPHCKGGSEERV